MQRQLSRCDYRPTALFDILSFDVPNCTGRLPGFRVKPCVRNTGETGTSDSVVIEGCLNDFKTKLVTGLLSERTKGRLFLASMSSMLTITVSRLFLALHVENVIPFTDFEQTEGIYNFLASVSAAWTFIVSCSQLSG